MNTYTQHRIIPWLITALTLISPITGCQTGEILSESNTSIIIKVSMPYQASETKAESQSVADQTSLIFKNGYLIFSDNTGEILYIATVVTGMSAGNTIGINDLTSTGGARVEGVPKEIHTVDFFGNPPTEATIPTEGTDINDFRKIITNITSQKDNDGYVSNISIHGSGTIDLLTTPYGARFEATAIQSRIETAALETDGIDIISFEVAGIFINHFHPEADLTGNPTLSPFIEYTSTNLFEEGGETYYATTYKKTLYDYQPTAPYLGQLNGYKYTPATTANVWSYNLFPGKVPHIIYKLKNVTASPARIATNNGIDPYQQRENWYITVTGFKTGSTILTQTEQGKVYALSTIPVNINTISPIPEPDGNILAEVKVKVMNWTDKNQSLQLPYYPW